MRIGIITTFHGADWGGSEELWYEMALAALATGNSVVICLTRNQGRSHRFREIVLAGATIFSGDDQRAATLARAALLLRRLFERRAFQGVSKVTAALHMALERFRDRRSALRKFFQSEPDIVLVNDGGSVPAADVRKAVRPGAERTPYVVLSHNNYGAVLDDVERAEVRKYYESALETCFVAEATRLATERQLACKVPATIVRNPVNLSDITLVPWPVAEPLRLATIGQLRVEWKGQDLLLDALSRPRWRNRDWQLSIFGAGKDHGYLGELITYYELGARVHLAGHADDIRSVWAQHHALVIPSRVESAPLVMVEAMLCGRPVISTEVGGVAEWLDHGHSGFIANGVSANALDETLDEAWTLRHSWQGIGSCARREALERYEPAAGSKLLEHLQRFTYPPR